MESQVHGPIVVTVLAMLAVVELAVVLFKADAALAVALHCSLLLVIIITGVAVALAIAGGWLAVRKCRARGPKFSLFDSRSAAREPTFPDDALPEFCSGTPPATIDQCVLFIVASPRRRGAGYDTCVARFDRPASAWKDSSGQIMRRLRHADRWLFLEQHRELIERASKRMGNAFNPVDRCPEKS